MAQQEPYLPSLRERAALSLQLATRVEQLLQSAACRGNGECMLRYRQLQQSSLLADMWVLLMAIERGTKPAAHGASTAAPQPPGAPMAMAQQAPLLPSLRKRAADSLLLATRVELLLSPLAVCFSVKRAPEVREEHMQRYRLLLAEQGSLLADMRALIGAMEDVEAAAHGDQLGPLLSSLPHELLSEGIFGRLQAGGAHVRGVSRALRAAFDALNTRLVVLPQSPLEPAQLASLVLRSPKLRDLSLQRCAASMAEVLRAAAARRHLDTLSLGIDVGDTATLVPALQELDMLRTLCLWRSDRLQGHFLTLPLAPVLLALTGLQTLTINGINMGARTALAPAVLGRLTGLQDLRLENVPISPEENAALAAALPALQGLRVLRLRPCDRTGNAAVLIMTPALLQLPGLRELGLCNYGHRYRDEGAAAFRLSTALWTLNSLQTLDMSDGESRSAVRTRAPIVQACPLQRLFSLNLAGQCMDLECFVALAPALIQQTALTSLNLRLNNMGVAVAALASVLRALTGLQELNLDNNEITAECAAALVPSLRALTRLQVLNLGCNQFGAQGAAALVPSLRALTGLQALDLPCTMAGGCCVGLAQALAAVPGLQALDLGSNGLRGTRFAAVEPALRALTALHTLDLTANKLGAKDAAPLSQVLMGLTALQTLSLWSNLLHGTALGPVLLALAGLMELRELNLRLLLRTCLTCSP